MNRFVSKSDYISIAPLFSRPGSYLAHHGVKGQKWGVRHERERLGTRLKRGASNALAKEAARGKKISTNKKGKFSILKSTLGVEFKGLARVGAAGFVSAAAGIGAAFLTGGNPMVAQIVGSAMFKVTGSAAILSYGRDRVDQICAAGAYAHSKSEERNRRGAA